MAEGRDAPSGKQTRVFHVRGMHCPNCELLVERKLSHRKGVQSVAASLATGEVRLECDGAVPTVDELNRLFAADGYTFSERPGAWSQPVRERLAAVAVAVVGIALFLGLSRLGLGSLADVRSAASLPAMLTLGLLAGVSSCAALAGGIVLSLAKQWARAYPGQGSARQRVEPAVLFSCGRLASYAGFGALLGGIGASLRLSPGLSSGIGVLASLIMITLALQMLGARLPRWLQVRAPRRLALLSLREPGSLRFLMPFAAGAATLLLPCGFTLTAEGLAILAASPLQGALTMGAFALGTVPMLFAIGLASTQLIATPRLSAHFQRVAAILVMFFALYNLNAQANALGLPSLSDVSLSHARPPAGTVGLAGLGLPTGQAQVFSSLPTPAAGAASTGQSDLSLPPVVGGVQVLKMDASASGYTPSHLIVRAGIPVRWEIRDTGTSGCTNSLVARGLFPGRVDLQPGSTTVKEFTPPKPGRYKFSCWMGMVSGVIEVVPQA